MFSPTATKLKRMLFIQGFKCSHFYVSVSEWGSQSCLDTPDPHDGRISKRQWEKRAAQWRVAHKSRRAKQESEDVNAAGVKAE